MDAYTKTVEWMFQQLPMFQRVGAKAFKKDLSRTIKLDEYLGNPHKNFKSVHIAGTNGKGSTSHMLASILQEAGYKVGLYTSPHLKDFRERIKVNGKFIPKKNVVGFIEEHRDFLTENNSLRQTPRLPPNGQSRHPPRLLKPVSAALSVYYRENDLNETKTHNESSPPKPPKKY